MSQNQDELEGQTSDVDEQTDDAGQQDTPPEAKLAPEAGANVILAHSMSPITVPGKEHEGEVNIGMDIHIKLPSEGQQRAGFKLDEREVSALIMQYPGRYKRFKPKAQPSAQQGGEA